LVIRAATSDFDLDRMRDLIREYSRGLGAHVCFSDLERELAGLPGEYASPAGALLLAEVESQAAGCVALRPLGEGICELKRLYVRPAFRGMGVARQLTLTALETARQAGYRLLRLDTLPTMEAAQRLYESLGFYDIPPYYENQIAGKRNMEVKLG
jgi:ribosomal protein S18 acetylase RimI-like enzyme